MRSAQRKARIIDKNRKQVRVKLLLSTLPIILILIIIGIFKFGIKYWTSTDKISVSYPNSQGHIGVTVMDPKFGEMTTLIIPGETQVEVARGYGTLRIKNVLALAKNEKVGGDLLPETVTQNLLLPVFLWSQSDFENAINGRIFGIIKFVLFPVSTNIPFADRVAMSMFLLRTKSSNKEIIDLGKSQFLVKETLNDGQKGFVLNGKISSRISALFTDTKIAESKLKVTINDATNSYKVSELIGGIMETLGGKVVAVNKQPFIGSDCLVEGGDSRIVKNVSLLLHCTRRTKGNNDELIITLDGMFVKRF